MNILHREIETITRNTTSDETDTKKIGVSKKNEPKTHHIKESKKKKGE